MSGSLARLTTVCSASTTADAATMGSRQAWGQAPWPPLPSTSMQKPSKAAMTGPVLTLILPAASSGFTWPPRM